MVPEGAVQASLEGKGATDRLPCYDTYEPHRQPARHDDVRTPQWHAHLNGSQLLSN